MAAIDIDLAGLDTAIVALVAGKVDLGTTNPTGRLRIADEADVELVSLDLANPAFIPGTPPEYTVDSLPLSDVAGASGDAVQAEFRDRDDVIIFSGTVSVVGGTAPFQLDRTAIEAGDTVSLQTGVLGFPAE